MCHMTMCSCLHKHYSRQKVLLYSIKFTSSDYSHNHFLLCFFTLSVIPNPLKCSGTLICHKSKPSKFYALSVRLGSLCTEACRDINARPTQTRYRRSHRKQLAGRPYGQLLQDYGSPAHFFGEDCDNSAHLFEGQWQPPPSLSTPKKWAGLEHWLNVSLRHHCHTIIQPDSHLTFLVDATSGQCQP